MLYRWFNIGLWETSALTEILTIWIEGYAGGSYDLASLPGRPALLSLKYQLGGDGRTREKVMSIGRLLSRTAPIQPENYERPEWLANIAVPERMPRPQIASAAPVTAPRLPAAKRIVTLESADLSQIEASKPKVTAANSPAVKPPDKDEAPF